MHMKMKCGFCSFHMMVTIWHLHLKTVQPLFGRLVDANSFDVPVLLSSFFPICTTSTVWIVRCISVAFLHGSSSEHS
jgi:hypothetical protein